MVGVGEVQRGLYSLRFLELLFLPYGIKSALDSLLLVRSHAGGFCSRVVAVLLLASSSATISFCLELFRGNFEMGPVNCNKLQPLVCINNKSSRNHPYDVVLDGAKGKVQNPGKHIG